MVGGRSGRVGRGGWAVANDSHEIVFPEEEARINYSLSC